MIACASCMANCRSRSSEHSPGRNQAVKLRINGQISLERDDRETRATAVVPVIMSTHTGAELEIRVDGRYLLDALAVDEQLAISRFGGPLDPVRLEVGEHVAVLMPRGCRPPDWVGRQRGAKYSGRWTTSGTSSSNSWAMM